MHHTESSIAPLNRKTQDDWQNIFKQELKTHSKQGLYLKGLRLRDGYSQKELGELINVSQSNVSAMEHGIRVIGKNIAKRLEKVFKGSLSTVFIRKINALYFLMTLFEEVYIL